MCGFFFQAEAGIRAYDVTGVQTCALPIWHLLIHIEQMITMLKNKRLVKKGDRVVITTGIPVGIPNWTNVIRVEEVP